MRLSLADGLTGLQFLDLALHISDFLLESLVPEQFIAKFDAELVVQAHIKGGFLGACSGRVLVSRLRHRCVGSLVQFLS